MLVEGATIGSHQPEGKFAFVSYIQSDFQEILKKSNLEMLKHPYKLMDGGLYFNYAFYIVLGLGYMMGLCVYFSYFFDSSRMEVLKWCYLNQRTVDNKSICLWQL